ncbi:DUF983 domain-containing protein [Alsobacter sp. R-9]
MPIVTTHTPSSPADAPRDVWQAMRRGALGRCPHCGEGHLFAGFLAVAPSCDRCGTEFHHHRADDLPAYIVIAIVGHVVVGGMLSAETYAEWPLWWHVVLWPSLTIALSLGMIRPIKGAVVALQWAFRMHGFGTHPDGDDMPALRPRAEDA